MDPRLPSILCLLRVAFVPASAACRPCNAEARYLGYEEWTVLYFQRVSVIVAELMLVYALQRQEHRQIPLVSSCTDNN